MEEVKIQRGQKKSEGSVFSKYEVMTLLGGSENSGVYLCRKKEKDRHGGLLRQLRLGEKKEEEEKLYVMKVLRINTVDPTRAEAIAAQDFFQTMDKVMDIHHPNILKVSRRFAHIHACQNHGND